MLWDKAHYGALMEKTLSILLSDLSGLRVGRPNVGLLDSVVVDIYGQKMRLNQIAVVNVLDNSSLSVKPHDSSSAPAIEKAIQLANLGVGIIMDASLIRLTIPKLTEVARKDLVKTAKHLGENAKISIRNIRRDGMDMLKNLEKDKEISQDLCKKFGDELQKITDSFAKKIDDSIIKKESDIMST